MDRLAGGGEIFTDGYATSGREDPLVVRILRACGRGARWVFVSVRAGSRFTWRPPLRSVAVASSSRLWGSLALAIGAAWDCCTD